MASLLKAFKQTFMLYLFTSAGSEARHATDPRHAGIGISFVVAAAYRAIICRAQAGNADFAFVDATGFDRFFFAACNRHDCQGDCKELDLEVFHGLFHGNKNKGLISP